MKNLFYVFCVSFLKNQLANKIFAFLLFLFLLLPQYACNTTEPLIPPEEQPPKAIKLKLLDVSCTEAFISISAADTVLPVNVTLKKDNAALFSFTLTTTDTTVIDTTLQPNITYIYQTTEIIKGKEENSDTIQVKTLNTPSHNFTWQTFTFGGIGGSSSLYDVAIIDENNIWTVGEIYADTTGLPFNAVHWDGSNWELKRISVDYNGNNITPPLYGIFAFSANDIWLSSGVPVHGDGTNWTQYHLFDMGVLGKNDGYLTKIWGNSSNDLYYVGTLGTIAHYQNGVWRKVESGTDLPINDIWGINYNVQSKLLAIASDKYQIKDKKILSISSNNVTEISNAGLPWSLGCTWFSNRFKSYVGGDGLYVKYDEKNYWNGIPSPPYYTFSIRGNRLNDIVVCGGLGYIGHFNGVSWINYLGNGLNEFAGNYYKISIKGNKMCAVGATADGYAVTLIGTR